MPYWTMKFVDLSRWQGEVNFQALWDLGYRYVLLRCTVGATYKDDRFHEYYEQARAVGFEVGVYFAINPAFSPEAHWSNFTQHLGDREVVIVTPDVELSGGQSASVVELRVRTTIELFRRNLPTVIALIVYTASWFWDRYIGNKSWALSYGLHMAQYPWLSPPEELPEDSRPTIIPAPWSTADEVDAWQWTDQAQLPTVTSSEIDKNVGKDSYFAFEPPQEPEPPPPLELATIYVLSNVNYRAGPGTEYPLLGTLTPSNVDYPAYQQVTGSNGVDKWIKIGMRSGKSAWLARIWRNPYTGIVYELAKFVDEALEPEPSPAPAPDYIEVIVNDPSHAVAWEITAMGSQRPIIETNAFTKYRNSSFKFSSGSVLKVFPPPPVKADGGDRFFKIFNLISPEGNELYVQQTDVAKLE